MNYSNKGFVRPTKTPGCVIPMNWGNSRDGVLTAGSTLISGADYEKYAGFAIRQYKAINWDPATDQVLTVDQPCRGLILMVDGPVYIGQHATISMAKKGSLLASNPEELLYLFSVSKKMKAIVDALKTLKGGPGGNGGTSVSYPGSPGSGGPGRVCQGGLGGGGASPGGDSSHTGGSGGSIVYPEVIGYPGAIAGADGLWGGGGSAYYSGNRTYRAGRPYGAGGGGSARIGHGGDGEHTGGFILLVAKGSVFIEGNLDVTGGRGGSGVTDSGGYPSGADGGSGGGVIAVFSHGAINTTSAVKTLTGGLTGAGGRGGTSGGSGTYHEERI